jgi:proteasome activator subunit 4
MPIRLDSEPTLPASPVLSLPTFLSHEVNGNIHDVEPILSDEDEDALLKDTTVTFSSWVDSFIRRVIQLLENLPEEGENGSIGGTES